MCMGFKMQLKVMNWIKGADILGGNLIINKENLKVIGIYSERNI